MNNDHELHKPLRVRLKRQIDFHLEKWRTSEDKKPLIIRGARQVGKTYAVRTLAKQFDTFIEINFELIKEARKFFQKDLIPERIMREIELFTKQDIVPGKTLLFFDEIQEAPEAIQALRYFYEMIPNLHVIAAGSLLDFALEKVGIPVGRVTNLYLYPLSFIEFLCATGEKRIAQEILNETPLSEVLHDKLLSILGEYLAIGGMPEAVAKWSISKNPKACFQIHHDIIENYEQDFEKYAKKHQIKYIEHLFKQIPHFVGEQFQYKNIHGEYRKRELAPCLDLMEKANIIHRVYHTAGEGVPLGAQVNLEWFKIIFLDVALTQAVLGFDLASWFLEPSVAIINRGMIAEAFVGQELLCYANPSRRANLHFWKRAQRGSNAEVDYIFDDQGTVLPIEVKSGHKVHLKSLRLFLDSHLSLPNGLRFSSHNYSAIDHVISRPLYSVSTMADPDQKQALHSIVR